eukprot:CAMPEP_0172328084 /NCGR_PEP_ID=MMETSP1058-20130122/60165_1 /TAXON_ID=83371 /ORGANISM="Detonula confervacea, Strain CCMP 353" /LENGTH=747 /DNA_ID=CAMNT_0013045181 /DNA_START=739 /DNA_END=2982 /DNA_ORIENTATION=-
MTIQQTKSSTRQELEKMTIKQLKSYIEEKGISIPRGEGANLKLKRQIVDFIWDNQGVNSGGATTANTAIDAVAVDDDEFNLAAAMDNNGANENVAVNGNNINGDEANGKTATTETTEESSSAFVPFKAKKNFNRSAGTGMPPLPTETTLASSISNERNNDDSSPKFNLTPKDRIVLDVIKRYPPLHESLLDAALQNNYDLQIEEITKENIEQCNLSGLNYDIPIGIGENDIRHLHHPMVKNVTQSDMDVVFIGTASCTPGMTRGVSCTALRLNWRGGRVLDDRDDNMSSKKKKEQKKKEQEQKQKQQQNKKGNSYVEARGPTTGTWLFDCGESTQLSIQRTPSIKPSKISKIFLTHCHGDHSFGLPGLLCLMGTDRDRSDATPPVEIYGPEGLRMWLRVAVRYSTSRVVPKYRVHELMDVPMAPEWEEGHRRNGRFYYQYKRDREENNGNGSGSGENRKWGMQGLAGADPTSWISRAPMISLEPSKDFGEVVGGRDIYPQYNHPQSTDGAPIWQVEGNDDESNNESDEDNEVSVYAAPMSHGVPCVGYVVQEHTQPGRLKPENVAPIIQRNYKGLVDAGVKNPMKVMAVVKNLPVGGSYTFPDGTVLKQEDVVEPPRKGRKIVICGDTADCRSLEGLAQGADVLVHEATNTFLRGIDKEGNLRSVTRDAKIHGHSTPYMAGEFAKRINAKKLVMNHFSARYKGDQSIDSMTIMSRMENQAVKASGLSEDSVAAAWDFMVLPVARNES